MDKPQSGVNKALELAADHLLGTDQDRQRAGVLSEKAERSLRYKEVQAPEYLNAFEVKRYHCRQCQMKERQKVADHG